MSDGLIFCCVSECGCEHLTGVRHIKHSIFKERFEYRKVEALAYTKHLAALI